MNTMINAKVATGLANLTGKEYFVSLMGELSQLVVADVVLISEINNTDKQARTVAVFNDGAIAENFEFSVVGSPFASMLNGKNVMISSQVQQLYPEDYLLADLSIDACAGVPLLNGNGRVTGFLVAMYRQPIENKSMVEHALQYFAKRASAELARKVATDKLLESESYLSGIIALTDDVLIFTDLQGIIRMASPSMASRFGWSQADVEGASFVDFLAVDARQLGIQEFERCISSDMPRLKLNLKIRHKAGMVCPVTWSAITTKINNEINGVVGIIQELPK